MEENGDNPKSELETSKLLNEYKKELLQEYKVSIESSSDTQMSAQQEAMIKVLMTENTQESSALTTLLATKSGTLQETQETSRMDEMQEKYKDVYTPIPEKYTEGSAELQAQKVYEAYPNYMSFSEFLGLADSFFEGTKIQLGQKLTEAEETQQNLDYDNAFAKAYESVGGEEAWHEMVHGAREIMAKYPVNNYGKDPRVTNATELARFENATVYEGLEKGKTVEEAKLDAKGLISAFMNISYSSFQQIDFLNNANMFGSDDWEVVDRNRDNKVDFNKANNSTMDLREYGIEGDWGYYDVLENQDAMISEIEKKIQQYNFMLNNEDLMKEAYSKLDPEYQDLGNNAGYQKMINENYLPRMEAGLNIFKKYKIYDS